MGNLRTLFNFFSSYSFRCWCPCWTSLGFIVEIFHIVIQTGCLIRWMVWGLVYSGPIFFGGEGRSGTESSITKATTGLLYQPRMMSVEKTCPSAALSTTNSTYPDSGSNPGRRGGMPATAFPGLYFDRKTQQLKFDIKELPVLFNVSPSSWWYGLRPFCCKSSDEKTLSCF
jgi:hypothetical protein